MRVACVSSFASYWGRMPVDILDLETGMTCGGGEENFLECAAGLAQLGHEVHAWWCGDTGTWRGVEFNATQAQLYSRIAGEEWDAVACWSGLRPLMYAKPGTRRLMVNQLNDLAVPGPWNAADVIVSPSLNHAAMVYGWGWRGKRAVVHNGLDIERYSDAPSWAERPMDVGYWSSPDRGLHHLLRAWPLIRKAAPKAKLHVGYEIKRYLELAKIANNNYFAARGREIAYLLNAFEGDDSVVFHGAIPRKPLAKIQKQCRVMCFPYDTFAYCEGFCGALNQGITAGCLAMATPKDALPSLYGDSVHWLRKPTTDADFSEWLAGETVKALHGELPRQAETLAAGVKNADRYTWAKAAKEFEAVCRGENWIEGLP